MFKLKKNLNLFIYKIYKNLRYSTNKEKILVLNSTGIDSGLLTNILYLLIGGKAIILFFINHNTSRVDNNCKIKLLNLKKKIKIKIFFINLNKKKKIFIKENILRIKREKKLKILSKKLKIKSLWNGHHWDDELENNLINYFYKNKYLKKNIYYKNKLFLIKKNKPLKKIKKRNIKIFLIKIEKWIEEYSNLKKINIRNIIRIKKLKIIRDVAERFIALPC